MIRALLIAVSDYHGIGLVDLPLCKNDLDALQRALVNGLNARPQNILIYGGTGVVTFEDLAVAFAQLLRDIEEEDTFIFYFSGHGGNSCLCLSDRAILIQELINFIDQVPAKNKVVILDCCHAGDFSLGGVSQISIEEMVGVFVGKGCAVMASCGAGEESGFCEERKISLYTSFVCDALTFRPLIRKGKKSLEEINRLIFRFAEISNQQRATSMQHPIYRSSINGTIFFNVEDYHPYKQKHIYFEAEEYIIYEVEPVHIGITKRYSVKVILRFPDTPEQIAAIADDVKNTVLYCDVYNNQIAERRFKGRPANIVWCFFGYNEDDMVNGNYAWRTTWVDKSQDKTWWYRLDKDSNVINGIHIKEFPQYKWVNEVYQKTGIPNDELISLTRECTNHLIELAREYINTFREYRNKTITETQLIDAVAPICDEILKLYIKQSDFPMPPAELHGWAQAHTELANTIHDFSLFYNKRYMDKWTKDNREMLCLNTIKRYTEELEKLRIIDGTVQL